MLGIYDNWSGKYILVDEFSSVCGKAKCINVPFVADKDARLRSVKDRQNEERQKKLEEIKAQALAAQRFKEQKEEERRRRLEELRIRDDVRRQQVEERKRAINDAERYRLESILRRNQEREQRIEARRRNEKSNIVFAFGSSTPRMLDPTDLTVSFWGHRRATSIQNITCSTSSLTRRQSERDLDVGNKKRATSATGLERSGENSVPQTPAGCASGYTGRRRTDLVPTIPSRDSSFSSSRKSLNHSPGRAYSMTRLDQLAKPRKRPDLPSLAESSPNPRPLSSPRISSVTRSMSHLAVSKTGPSPTRRPLNKADSRSMHHLSGDGVLSAPRTTRTTQLREQKLHASSNCSEARKFWYTASSRPSSSLSQQSTNSVTSSVSVSRRPATTPRRPRPASIAVTGITHDLKNADKLADAKPPLPKTRKPISKPHDKHVLKSKVKSPVDSIPKEKAIGAAQNVVNKTANAETQQKPPDTAPIIQQKPVVEDRPPEIAQDTQPKVTNVRPEEIVPEPEKSDIRLVAEAIPEAPEKTLLEVNVEQKPVEVPVETFEKENKVVDNKTEEVKLASQTKVEEETTAENNLTNSDEMTASMTKVRISTEEEAKAALAERRRLIREEAERQAEMERLRIEAEAKAELERQQREEEQVRQLIEMQKQAEQERLKEAIKEAQKREEEERLKREEEQRLKLLKEEAEKKAREDAERQKAELQERLKNEEKEREARRKRVEAIMLRTRGKNNSNLASQQSTDDKNENKSEEDKVNEDNKLNAEDKLNEENKKNDDNKLKEESKVNGTKIVEQQENGTTKNGKDVDIVANIIPAEIVKNANTVMIETMNSTDTINSNNSWQDTQQYGNFVCNNNS
ncbi:hypothetical protein NQ315_010232 [Exocentrus adspersus]|uniref:Ensconsin-like n=1 Tax=Exocentrus adspersus TaxID=1586481 RepID=A0AAV8WBD4_9CUCU|nr:hypothetical protein NQ315_010232 [Exocentrus adspersus]